MPGANESSTVEWHSAQVMPTRVSVSAPLTVSTVPFRPTTAFSLSSATVVAGLRQVDAAVRMPATTAGGSASASTFRPTDSAVVGSTAVAMTSCMRSVSVHCASSPKVSKRKICWPCRRAAPGARRRRRPKSRRRPAELPRGRRRRARSGRKWHAWDSPQAGRRWMSRPRKRDRVDACSIMLDDSSIIQDRVPTLTDRIARRVRDLRAARGLSLDALATHCGVSRSMISLIERGESSPTAVLLEKLSVGLGVPLASLFDAPQPDAAAAVEARRPARPGATRRRATSGATSRRRDSRRRSRSSTSTFRRAPASPTRPARASRACTSRCGCSRAASRSRSAPSGIGSTPATAWRWCSTDRSRIRNPTRRRARYAVVITTEPVGAALTWTAGSSPRRSPAPCCTPRGTPRSRRARTRRTR